MIYEYRCESCGTVQEVFINQYDLTFLPLFCMKCKKEKMHIKKISLSNFKMPRGMINKDRAK